MSLLQAQSLKYDELRLKNGSTIRGMVDTASHDPMRIKTNEGTILQIAAADVDRVSLGRYTGVQGLKSPGLAFVCSFLLPGAGQHYNGEYLKGGLIEAVFGLGLLLAVDGKVTSTVGMSGILLMGSSSLYSMIDAPYTAYQMNEEKARQTPRAGFSLLQWEMNGRTACLGAYKDKYATGASFTLRF
jgi:hypothetical protein